jgi:Flp pilus assembly protein TadD
MPQILACPHCQARMVVAHDRCRRCGKPIQNAHVDASTGQTAARAGNPAPSPQPAATAFLIVAAALLLLLVAVAASAWWLIPAGDSKTSSSAPPPAAPVEKAPAVTADAPAATSGAAAPEAATGPAPGRDDGFQAYLAGDKAGALARYLAVVERRPDDAIALNNAGQLLVELGRAVEAVPYLKRAAAADPASAMIRFNLAAAYDKTGQWEPAIAAYREAAGIDPRDARTAHNLGLALHRAGREDEAAESFRRATRLAPEGAQAWMGLAQTLERLGKRAEAADAYERLASVQPDGPDIAAIRRRIEKLRTSATAVLSADAR